MKNLFAFFIATALCSTFTGVSAQTQSEDETQATSATQEAEPAATPTEEKPAYATIFTQKQYNKNAYFVVISKGDSPTLKVYAVDGKDTVLIANYSACVGIGKGNKQVQGDHRTPEGTFTISSIENKKGVKFNYGSANQKKWYPGAENKPVEAYGAWFCRLKGVASNGKNISSNGIGIHGSGANEACLPLCNKPLEKGHHKGRDSAGCIRLSNSGIIHFRNHYAHVGMKVIIKAEGQGKLPFEK